MRGGNYYILGEFDAAMNHYRQGLKFDPEHQGCKRCVAVYCCFLGVRLCWTDVCSGHRLVKKIQQTQSKAQAALDKKDFDTAVKHLQTLLEADPEHRTVVPKARVDLATALKGADLSHNGIFKCLFCLHRQECLMQG